MKVFSQLTHIHNLSLALGFFDGVHLGHGIVIKNAVKYAVENGVKSGILLFHNHPREFFTRQKFEHIITFNDKIAMFNKMGVDYVFHLDFNENFAKMTPDEYMENIILPYFQPSAVTTGYNHTFGSGASGNFQTLQEYSKNFNFKYFQIPPVTAGNITISSTAIRNAIKGSDFLKAKELLGYDFYVKSPVYHGRQIGRTINFPTANIAIPEETVKIELGVYYVLVEAAGKIYNGVLNYGLRPTVEKGDVVPVPEVHLLGFNGNLYGHVIKVSFISKIREEVPFNSLEELKEQISKDCKYALSYNIHKKTSKPAF